MISTFVRFVGLCPLPLQLVCRRSHVLIMLFVFFTYSGVKYILTISVTWRVSCKWQELVASIWVHFPFLVGSVLFIFLVFCVVLFVLFVFVLCLVFPMLPVFLNCPFLIALSVSLTFICIMKKKSHNTNSYQILRKGRFRLLNACHMSWSIDRAWTEKIPVATSVICLHAASAIYTVMALCGQPTHANNQ